MITQRLAPTILRTQYDDVLCAIASRLDDARLEETESILLEALGRLEDVRDEETRELHHAVSRRAHVRRAIQIAALEAHAAFGCPIDCATGWPDYTREWSGETLPIAAVAAGVDADRVVSIVLTSLPTLDADPIPQRQGCPERG